MDYCLLFTIFDALISALSTSISSSYKSWEKKSEEAERRINEVMRRGKLRCTKTIFNTNSFKNGIVIGHIRVGIKNPEFISLLFNTIIVERED